MGDISEAEMLAELKRCVRLAGGASAFAASHGLHRPNVSAMIHGSRTICASAANACGFFMNRPTYRKIRED